MSGSAEIPLLVVLLEGRRFAFRLEHVQEVLPLAEPTPVPGWPRYGLGLLRVRGDVVPLVDLRTTLQLPDAILNATQKVVLVHADSRRWGILVSAVTGVVEREVEKVGMVAPQPRLVRAELSNEFTSDSEGLMAVLDPTALILTLGLPLPPEASA
jgi:purine-binding chemotaxis protein CheW